MGSLNFLQSLDNSVCSVYFPYMCDTLHRRLRCFSVTNFPFRTWFSQDHALAFRGRVSNASSSNNAGPSDRLIRMVFWLHAFVSLSQRAAPGEKAIQRVCSQTDGYQRWPLQTKTARMIILENRVQSIFDQIVLQARVLAHVFVA